MRTETLYYADGDPTPFKNIEQALARESNNAARVKNWASNSSGAICDKLLFDVQKIINQPCYHGFISIVSWDYLKLIQIRDICKNFAETHKDVKVL